MNSFSFFFSANSNFFLFIVFFGSTLFLFTSSSSTLFLFTSSSSTLFEKVDEDITNDANMSSPDSSSTFFFFNGRPTRLLLLPFIEVTYIQPSDSLKLNFDAHNAIASHTDFDNIFFYYFTTLLSYLYLFIHFYFLPTTLYHLNFFHFFTFSLYT